jgi:hypothetical protein
VLRWNSYVNLRHIYKIKWEHLRPYTNTDTPWSTHYRLERESMIRMLAKGKILTTYEPGTQLQRQGSPRPAETSIQPTIINRVDDDLHSPDLDAVSTISSDDSECSPLQSDFPFSKTEAAGNDDRPPKAPPDKPNNGGGLYGLRRVFQCIYSWPRSIFRWLWIRLLSKVW